MVRTNIPDLYQTVGITLADGRVLTYTGRAQVPDDPDPKKYAVVGLAFSKGYKLPEGMSFQDIHPNTEEEE